MNKGRFFWAGACIGMDVGIRRGITADVLTVTDEQFDTIERVLVGMRISVEQLADYPVQAYCHDKGGMMLTKRDNLERDCEIEWKRS